MNNTDNKMPLETDNQDAVSLTVEQTTAEKHKPARLTTKAGLTAYGLFFTGLSLLLVSVISGLLHWPEIITVFIRDLGLLLSAVMAGTILHEKLLRDDMVRLIEEELDQKLKASIPEIEESAVRTAKEVHRLFSEHPPRMTGIRLLYDVRRNFPGYYGWMNEQKPQELFFAGRSVLHRIDADIRARATSCAEDILLRRLREGAKIRVLFLDPRIDILKRLADEEGQTLEAMLGDIATSIGICKRLFDLLQKNYASLGPESDITIRVYDRVPYFAYHRQDDQVIVGFYFLSSKGSSSAAYEVIDEETRQVFGDHFVRIFSEAAHNTLVEFDGARGRPRFDQVLFDQLHDCLSQHLGADQTNQLINRE